MGHRRVGLVLLLFFMALAGQTAAECKTHNVRAGDTLRKIAEKYYGSRDRSGQIFSANRRQIGANPNQIEPGMRLYIPCSDPGLPVEKAAEPVAAMEHSNPVDAHVPNASAMGSTTHKAEMTDTTMHAEPDMMHEDKSHEEPMHEMPGDEDTHATDMAMSEKEMADKPEQILMITPIETDVNAIPMLHLPNADPMIHILTGGPYAPFVGPNLPSGGMMTELVQAAMAKRSDTVAMIGFVNDRSAHLETILPRGGFALAFPWIYPNCEDTRLSASQQYLCDNFRASDGFYELVTEYYARADLKWAKTFIPSALAGARICRPDGYSIDDLIEMRLLPGQATLVRGRSPTDCLEMLDRGEVDIASMDAAVTRALIDQITVENPIVVLEPLTRIEKLRVLAPKSDIRSVENIMLINTALRDMSDDGTWFEIVTRHLSGENPE